MTPGILTVSGFFWLVVFMLVALVINKVRGKPTVNGALVYSWVVGALSAVFIVAAIFRPAAQEFVIEWVAGVLVPYVVALFFARRYLKRTAPLPPITKDA